MPDICERRSEDGILVLTNQVLDGTRRDALLAGDGTFPYYGPIEA